jgi:hypothetical protein
MRAQVGSWLELLLDLIAHALTLLLILSRGWGLVLGSSRIYSSPNSRHACIDVAHPLTLPARYLSSQIDFSLSQLTMKHIVMLVEQERWHGRRPSSLETMMVVVLPFPLCPTLSTLHPHILARFGGKVWFWMVGFGEGIGPRWSKSGHNVQPWVDDRPREGMLMASIHGGWIRWCQWKEEDLARGYGYSALGLRTTNLAMERGFRPFLSWVYLSLYSQGRLIVSLLSTLKSEMNMSSFIKNSSMW